MDRSFRDLTSLSLSDTKSQSLINAIDSNWTRGRIEARDKTSDDSASFHALERIGDRSGERPIPTDFLPFLSLNRKTISPAAESAAAMVVSSRVVTECVPKMAGI